MNITKELTYLPITNSEGDTHLKVTVDFTQNCPKGGRGTYAVHAIPVRRFDGCESYRPFTGMKADIFCAGKATAREMRDAIQMVNENDLLDKIFSFLQKRDASLRWA